MIYDFLIVGAGLSGAIFAHEAKKHGYRCAVIDRRDTIAGNLYTENVHGIDVHKYGAHIFHTNDGHIWQYVNEICEFKNFVNSPIANYKGRVFNLPFNMNTFAQMWGISKPEEAKKIIEKQRLKLSYPPSNLEEQALSLVGKDIYEILIKGYTEKQWGRDCSELPADIIKRLPVRFTYDNNYFNHKYQGIPALGYTEFIRRLLEGADVFLNMPYNQCSIKARKTIYTGCIDEFFNYQLGELEYRSLEFKTRIEQTSNYQGVAVVNYTERSVPFTRVIEHKHFNYVDVDLTVITEEYPQNWSLGFEPYYPINDERNSKLYKAYCKLAEGNQDLIFIGRLGTYRYMDMDKVIADTLEVCQKIL